MKAGSFTAPEPPGLFYRFSVKCDRTMNAAINKAATACGVSVSQFVQDHFETILDRSLPVDAIEKPASTEEKDIARSCGITVGMLRVHRAMKLRANSLCNYQDGMTELAQATDLSPGSVRVMVSRLVKAGLLKHLRQGARGNYGSYHVYSIGDG